jgi:probable rRNA maturation factor
MKSDPLITCRRKPASLDLVSLESFAEVLRKRVAGGREFHCLITGDAELQKLNRQFRGKNYPTDVLSFPTFNAGFSEPDGRRGDRGLGSRRHKNTAARVGQAFSLPIGDIAISLARARAQAREWNHTTEDELRILILHGLLHLTGLDHETDSGEMKQTELRWRKKLGLPVGLIERSADPKARAAR